MAFVLALRDAGSRKTGWQQVTPDRSLQEAVFAALEEQLDNASQQVELAAAAATSDKAAAEAVHEARKSLKRLRATLRLLRRGLGAVRITRERRQLAAVGRELAATREAQVMNDVLRDLKRACAAPRPAAPAGELGEHEAGAEPLPDYTAYAEAVATAQKVHRELPAPTAIRPSQQVREQVVGELAAVRRRVARWSLRGKAWRSLRDALALAVRQTRRAWEVARVPRASAQAAEQFHELRKRVKDLYYMASLLVPAQPETLGALAKELDLLADLLGDDHDLAVLIERAQAYPDEFGGALAVTPLLELAALRQQALRETARPLAESLLELKPRRFARTVVQGLRRLGAGADSSAPANPGNPGCWTRRPPATGADSSAPANPGNPGNLGELGELGEPGSPGSPEK